MYSIFLALLLFSLFSNGHNKNPLDPISYENFTTCEVFEKGAKFDPTTIVDSVWRIFYFWSHTTEIEPVYFSLIHKSSLKRFKEDLEATHPHWDIMWHLARFFFFPRPGVQVLYMDAYTPGAYRAIVKINSKSDVKPEPGPKFTMADIRMKQVDRFIFMMCCEDLTGYAMVREKEVPRTQEECEDMAKVMKYRGFEGRCYLELIKKINERNKNSTELSTERPAEKRTERGNRIESQAHLPAGFSPPSAKVVHRGHRAHRRLKRHRKDGHLVLQPLKTARDMLIRRRTGVVMHSNRLWGRKMLIRS